MTVPCVDTLTPAVVIASRTLMGWSRGRLARLADVTYEALKEYEYGSPRTRLPTREKIALVLRVYGVVLDADGKPTFRHDFGNATVIVADLGEWLDMTTAPKDGTSVDLLDVNCKEFFGCRWELCDVGYSQQRRHAWSGFTTSGRPVGWREHKKG